MNVVKSFNTCLSDLFKESDITVDFSKEIKGRKKVIYIPTTRYDDHYNELKDLLDLKGYESRIIMAGTGLETISKFSFGMPDNIAEFTREFRSKNSGEFPYVIMIEGTKIKGNNGKLKRNLKLCIGGLPPEDERSPASKGFDYVFMPLLKYFSKA